MSKKQDRQGVRTAAELERKYNLGQSVSQSYVQSVVNTAVTASANESKNYIDAKVKDVTELEQYIIDAKHDASEAKATAEEAQAAVEEAQAAVEEAQAAVDELQNTVDELSKVLVPTEGTGLIVTVEADSLSTENLTSDKTFAEIEDAILSGMNVIVKLICDGIDYQIYLHMTAHLQGSEIAFSGYFNNLPLVLKIMAE
jgi:uncharacterized protein YlxW (UPF0749 family)